MGKEMNAENRIAVFENREIRKTFHNGEWWFVIEDIVSALTNSVQPKGYIKDMRRRDKELSKGWGKGQSGTKIILKNFDKAAWKQIDFYEIKNEIEKHFELLLSRKNLEIKLTNEETGTELKKKNRYISR